MYGDYYGLGFGTVGVIGAIINVLWVILIVMGIVYLVRWMRHDGGSLPRLGRSALDILNERYAKGEIDKAEYEEKKRDLAA